jgi:hypothetical protein
MQLSLLVPLMKFNARWNIFYEYVVLPALTLIQTIKLIIENHFKNKMEPQVYQRQKINNYFLT